MIMLFYFYVFSISKLIKSYSRGIKSKLKSIISLNVPKI